MTIVISAQLPAITRLIAADTTAKSANGGLGLVVVFAIGVVLFVLLRSMSRHLRKVDKMKRDGVFDTAATSTTVQAAPAPSSRDYDDPA
jgi:hypothetical protein